MLEWRPGKYSRFTNLAVFVLLELTRMPRETFYLKFFSNFSLQHKPYLLHLCGNSGKHWRWLWWCFEWHTKAIKVCFTTTTTSLQLLELEIIKYPLIWSCNSSVIRLELELAVYYTYNLEEEEIVTVCHTCYCWLILSEVKTSKSRAEAYFLWNLPPSPWGKTRVLKRKQYRSCNTSFTTSLCIIIITD